MEVIEFREVMLLVKLIVPGNIFISMKAKINEVISDSLRKYVNVVPNHIP